MGTYEILRGFLVVLNRLFHYSLQRSGGWGSSGFFNGGCLIGSDDIVHGGRRVKLLQVCQKISMFLIQVNFGGERFLIAFSLGWLNSKRIRRRLGINSLFVTFWNLVNLGRIWEKISKVFNTFVMAIFCHMSLGIIPNYSEIHPQGNCNTWSY